MGMDSTSSFTKNQSLYSNAERLPVSGTTCECYRVKLYGKWHFLKRLKPELRTDPHYVAALEKEFQTGYQLDHPHLVRYVAKTDDGVLMDYIDGDTLKQFAAHHPDYFKKRSHSARFLSQLLSAVDYLHQHQIVHLDLKPDNILITRVGHDVKLTDLGFCYTDTYTDTMGRTDKYAAPEQLDGSGVVDERTDIYAIGKLIATLPCARAYSGVIKRCTAPHPADRYQHVGDVLKALTRNRQKRLLGIVVSVVLVLAFVVVSLLYLLSGSRTDEEKAPPQQLQPRDTVATSTPQPVSPNQDSQTAYITDAPNEAVASELTVSSPASTTTEAPTPASSPQSAYAPAPSSQSAYAPAPSSPPVTAPSPAPTQNTSSVSKVDVQQPSSPPETAVPVYTAPSSTTEISRLRREADQIVRPYFIQYLAKYRNRDLHKMYPNEVDEYTTQEVVYKKAIWKLAVPNFFRKYSGKYSAELLDSIFQDVLRFYNNQLFLPSRR